MTTNMSNFDSATEASDSAAEGCMALILTWILGWGTVAVRSLVAMKGWEWFVADTFGIQTVSFVQAWGILVLVPFVATRFDTSKSDRRPLAEGIYILSLSLAISGFAFVSLLILSNFL